MQFMTMWEMQILASAIAIEKENWGNRTFCFRDNLATRILKSAKIQNS